MAYSDQIEYLKSSLNSYSEEEEKLSQLYKTAMENIDKAHSTSMKQLEKQYQDDRNEVYADVARDERNLYTVLAERGLGFSGEAAQAKLNSNITLSNRLGALADEKYQNALQLELDLANNKTNLSMEEAEKLRDILNSKNQFNMSIAQMELDKETEANKIRAEKDMLAEKLKAEREMFEAELKAKYYSAANGNSGNNSSGGNKNNGGSKNESENENQENSDTAYIPSISEKELAKQLINAATDGEKYRQDGTHEYLVNKYLLELISNYNLDEDYFKNLMFILKSYGYKEISVPEMRVQVIGFDSETYYYNVYKESYNKYIYSNMNEGTARYKARQDAFKAQIDYIYKRSNSVIEFEKCCSELGISSTYVNEYLANIRNQSSGAGSGTALNGGVNRVPQ